MVVHDLPSGKRYCSICKSTSCEHVKVYSEVSNAPPIISHGSNNLPSAMSISTSEPLTVKQFRALELYNDGNSISSIGKSLAISKGSAYDLIKRAIRSAQQRGLTPKRLPLTTVQSSPLTIRLHNDEFKFAVRADYESIPGSVKCQGRNLEYKILSYESKIYMKLHRNCSLTVRFRESIFSDSEDKACALADERLMRFIGSFNFAGICINSERKLISRHYGLDGTSMARKIIDERKLIIVRDPDGKVRLRIDGSPVVGFAKGEIDAEHTEKGKSDIAQTREYLASIINKPHYLPHEVKSEIDSFKEDAIAVRKDLIEARHEAKEQYIWMKENWKSHKKLLETNQSVAERQLDVQDSTLETLKSIRDNLDRSNDVVSNGNVRVCAKFEPPKTISKYDLERKEKIKRLKEEFGW